MLFRSIELEDADLYDLAAALHRLGDRALDRATFTELMRAEFPHYGQA